MPDAPAPGAQPGADVGAPGQGPEGIDSSNGLYPDLSNVPEGVRQAVLPLLKEYEGNATRKFQEAAEYRKQWEPFEQLGINQIDPEEMADLLAFRELASDPDQFAEWYQQVGEQLELGGGPQYDQQPSEEGGMDMGALEDMIGRALDQRLGPIEQTFQQQQEAQNLAQAESYITSQLDGLQEQHGEFDRDAVCQLALAYDGPEAVEKGFADYQRLIGQAEKGVLSGKLQQPPPPEQGGRPGTQAKSITDFGEASQAAREMLRRAQQT
jgi:hypothetical protein